MDIPMSVRLTQKVRDSWLLDIATQTRTIRALMILVYAKTYDIPVEEAKAVAQKISTEFLTHFLAEATKREDSE